MQNIVPASRIEEGIFEIRGYKVMFDRDLAQLYEVTTGALNQAVQRNKDRFPEDFMFQLNKEEMNVLKEHIRTQETNKMGFRPAP